MQEKKGEATKRAASKGRKGGKRRIGQIWTVGPFDVGQGVGRVATSGLKRMVAVVRGVQRTPWCTPSLSSSLDRMTKREPLTVAETRPGLVGDCIHDGNCMRLAGPVRTSNGSESRPYIERNISPVGIDPEWNQ